MYKQHEIFEITQKGLDILNNLKKCVRKLNKDAGELSESEIENIGRSLGLENVSGNPLFRKSVEACIKK